jgi:hypothetical protein
LRFVIAKLLPLLLSSFDNILLDFGVMSVSLKLQRLAERNSFTLKIEAARTYISTFTNLGGISNQNLNADRESVNA